MEEHCVRKESPRRSLAHLENVCRLRVNYTTVCRNPLVESRETPVSRQRHWLPQHRGGGRGEMMIFGGIPVPSHLVTKDDCGYHYDEFLPNNCAAVSASSRSHLSELRPRRIRKSFAGSRDSWTTRRQGKGRCTGISGSSPGPSARSSPSRPGPKVVAVPVYLDAQLPRACGEATGY